VPLARVAYGATQTDRWRAEAEHYQKGPRMSYLVDDDETVITALYTGKDTTFDDAPTINTSTTWGGLEDDSASLMEKLTSETNDVDPKGHEFTNIATRVRTAAQVFISPCIIPSISPNKNVENKKSNNFDASTIAVTKKKTKQNERS